MTLKPCHHKDSLAHCNLGIYAMQPNPSHGREVRGYPHRWIRYARWRHPSGGDHPRRRGHLAGDNPPISEAITPPLFRTPRSRHLLTLAGRSHTTTQREHRRSRQQRRARRRDGKHQHGIGHIEICAGRGRAQWQRQRREQRPQPCQLRPAQQARQEAHGSCRGGGSRAAAAGGEGGRRGRRGDQGARRRQAAADWPQEGSQGEDPEEGVLLVQWNWIRCHG